MDSCSTSFPQDKSYCNHNIVVYMGPFQSLVHCHHRMDSCSTSFPQDKSYCNHNIVVYMGPFQSLVHCHHRMDSCSTSFPLGISCYTRNIAVCTFSSSSFFLLIFYDFSHPKITSANSSSLIPNPSLISSNAISDSSQESSSII
ncbi:hypothetical protein Mpt1_c08560 [Candidatus Methanoplasma termitum]|uniref:Uncharacterized protein n=1 Tax=Candidatus Methanoplasma termitum TaxID=1577791 RepID=A0A0A7LEJ3_9ARCH|nr:hypothetical protein Mpt1_c08560 [Candidatus Methanoplasma termitum]